MDIDREDEIQEAYQKYDPGWTAPPYDARYPHDNQLKYCLQSFIDYYRCRKIKGLDYTNCFYFRRCAENMCPSFLLEKWIDQVRENRFEHHAIDWEEIKSGKHSKQSE